MKPLADLAFHGRRLLWRAGRKAYQTGRLEVANAPASNGEHWLLSTVSKFAPAGIANIIDVGANVGDWTAAAIERFEHVQSLSPRFHCIEPAAATFAHLANRFRSDSSTSCYPVALASSVGEVDFYVGADLAGTNSLHPSSGQRSERIATTTIDAFIRSNMPGETVILLKIDAEGFDFDILQGARESLRSGNIEIVQFEYNWRWLYNSASLYKVFELASDLDYKVGKLVGRGIQFFPTWHFELDRFFEGNYTLVRTDSPLAQLGNNFEFDDSNLPSLTSY